MDGVMIPLHIMVLRWKGPIKGPIHSSTNLAQEVLRVVLKECMKIGILAGEDPQMSPHKEGALKSRLVRSVLYLIMACSSHLLVWYINLSHYSVKQICTLSTK